MKSSTTVQKIRQIPAAGKAEQQGSAGEDASGSTSISARLDHLHKMTIELITPYITMSIDQIDSEIRGSIRNIVELLDLDRAFVAQNSIVKKCMICTHYFETLMNNEVVRSSNINVPSWVLGKLRRGEVVLFSSVADLPEKASKAKEYFRSVGTKSHISLPLQIDGNVIGCLPTLTPEFR